MNKRIIISSILGLLAGVICILIGKLSGIVKVKLISTGSLAGIINRTMIGFFIGISGWKINVYLRASIIGLIISFQMAIFHPIKIAIPYLIMGIVYGLLIEFLLSKVFKAQSV